ncbi:DMT family transporter [Terrilactibacillus laevilacticus]|uniref:DMT family transporter n=1 Tax=Terrilactibacillus laevilacticus TaxID=1380157 RepID=A0ABW5PVB1_9BACI|nr:DMT family transporter [Terrilactibacillus laevilacticus]
MKKNIIYIVICSVLISSMEINLKIAGASFNSIQLTFLRFLVGGLILLPFTIWSLKKRGLSLKARHWGIFALNGLILVVVSMTFYQLGVDYTKASTVAVLFSSNPIFALILSSLFLKEKLSRSLIISMILSVIGLIVIVNPINLTDPAGITFAILGAMVFGLYSFVSKWAAMYKGINGMTMTAFSCIIGSLELLVLIVLTHVSFIKNEIMQHPALASFKEIPVIHGLAWHDILVLLLVGIGNTGIAFALYFVIMERSNLSMASLPFFIKPALAPIMAFFILSETFTANLVIGIIIILVGSVLTVYGNRLIAKPSDSLNHHRKSQINEY